MILGFDTETTGIDFNHGSQPFLVTTCVGTMNKWWEFEVQPTTRNVLTDNESIEEIIQTIQQSEKIVGHNIKFDVRAIRHIGIKDWPWHKTEDTLIAAHVLASNQPKTLTDLVIRYLQLDISPFEELLKECVNESRRLVKKELPGWVIAEEGLPCMPSAEKEVWRNDYWLPRAVANFYKYDKSHRYHTVTRNYANTDSAAVIPLWEVLEYRLKKEGLYKIYRERMKVVPIVESMERRGITLYRSRLEAKQIEYTKDSEYKSNLCVTLAKSYGYDLTLPKAGRNKSLDTFVWEVLKLPVVNLTEKGNPSLNANAKNMIMTLLEENTKPWLFLKSLNEKSKRDTALTYMKGYTRFWKQLRGDCYRVFPNLNITGTDTTRFSSNNPNEQNISAKEEANLREIFGPGQGREQWSLDAENIELRLPAYECGEDEMIQLFERPNDPPYFGSNHLLVCHILHEEKFEYCIKHGLSFKDEFKSLYKKAKNGNFAVQYGAMPESGTADRAYGVPGAQLKIMDRFSKIKLLSKKWIDFANKHGYVETIPDRTLGCERGYPLLCSRSAFGGIRPTTPLSYHIQGSQGWWTMCGASW
jgi:DNA polymerase I-like protein with 3'-5' exonuclease and polymerase domains